jgi:ABC-2 type transport system ATP-binding protein
MVEAENLCDRIAIMDGGRIVSMDTPEGLIAMAKRNNSHRPTLEDVFLELTGRELVQESDLPI